MKHLNANYNTNSGMGPLFDKPPKGCKVFDLNSNRLISEGQQLKEKGLKLVRENNENWMDKALSVAFGFTKYRPIGRETFTGEDIRFRVIGVIGHPRHPNAFGALINTLIKRKIIVPTGEHRQMKDRSSHARSTPVYKAR